TLARGGCPGDRRPLPILHTAVHGSRCPVMDAVRKTGPEPEDLELEQVPRPTADAGQVVVRVAASGICGTDLHIIDGSYGSRPPVTLGHEVSGTITAVGDGVEQARIGDRVALETFFSTCGRCSGCRDGSPN